ncbi:MAG: M20/M25/M40 family metallo-hydrolase, partial [Phototrophicaceae bacterium]
IIVIGAVEEEAASSKGALYAATQYKPRLCVIGEPSHWDRFTLGYKGRVLMEWRWEGGFSHSAGEAPSAGENAFAYWRRIMDYANACNAGKTAVFEQLTPSLREINTGSSGYGTHQWAQMTLGIRLPLGIDPYQLVRDLAPTDDARLRAYGHEVAFASEKDNALTRALRGAIREAGSKPRFLYKTGTADMNVVGPRWGCPIVAYGPGDSALDHTPHEHLDLDEYGRAVQVLTSALTRLAGEA